MLDKEAQCYRHRGEEHKAPKDPAKVCNRRHRYLGARSLTCRGLVGGGWETQRVEESQR